jgi:hypothetical protein
MKRFRVQIPRRANSGETLDFPCFLRHSARLNPAGSPGIFGAYHGSTVPQGRVERHQCIRRHNRVVLVQPADNPSVIMIRWPDAPTITTAARYPEVASAAMRLLAEASTMLARIRASKQL